MTVPRRLAPEAAPPRRTTLSAFRACPAIAHHPVVRMALEAPLGGLERVLRSSEQHEAGAEPGLGLRVRRPEIQDRRVDSYRIVGRQRVGKDVRSGPH